MDNQEFAKRLRVLARIYDHNDDLPQVHGLTTGAAFVFCHDKKAFSNALRIFGPGPLEETSDCFSMTTELFPCLKVCGFKKSVCEQVLVTKEVTEWRFVDDEKVVVAEPESQS